MPKPWFMQQADKMKIRHELFRRGGGRRGSIVSPFGQGNVVWVQCHYCGWWLKMRGKTQHDHAVLAHIIPICYGGLHTVDNLVFACYECDQSDGKKYNYLGSYLLRYPALPAPPLRLMLPAP